MDINELLTYNLADAVKFNDQLNPRIWGSDEKMLPKVRDSLLKIAQDFEEFLGISNVQVKDITISGSNAGYTYTDHSDIDLHLVVDLPNADQSEVYRELFDAKKYQYNDLHDIKIGGYDVELYVQNANEKHHSRGIYSIVNNDWVSVPGRRRADVNDESVKSKYQDLAERINQAVKQGSHDQLAALMTKIKKMRQAGLDKNGEFSAENLAFKMLRTQGFIKKLADARNDARDQQLSLDERNKKPKKKKRVNYAYGGYWYPGTAYAGQDQPSGTEGGGGDGGGGESIRESANDTETLKKFFDRIVSELGIENPPKVILHKGSEWTKKTGSFGQFDFNAHVLHLAVDGRHILDMLRTMAHELVHCRQGELQEFPDDAGKTGSPYEDEANAMAGRIMRGFADTHPELFKDIELTESSGYIPTEAEKDDPRFAMALTKDVKPGATGKEANKLNLKTDSQGHPNLLMKGLRNALREFKETGRLPSKAAEDYSPEQPPGPESKPTMPKGTLRVDVSDVYDWYKLGQHISNLKGLGQHDFGKGPPSSIISFGDEDTEHKFIKDLEATGLDITDVDPLDPAQPAGMKKIKTDPTYNVNESLTEDDIFEVSMKPSMLRQAAANINAKAGVEFEMIVPNVDTDDEDNYQPDYDEDQRTRSWVDIEEFFLGGDNSSSRREVERAIQRMQEEFYEAMDEKILEDWADEQFEYVKQWIINNVQDEDILDFGEYDDEDREKFAADPEFREKVIDDYVQNAIDIETNEYEEAKDEYLSDMRGDMDESGWLDRNYRFMTDVSENFDLGWPYWNNGEGGDVDIATVADSFKSKIDKPVEYSTGYHTLKRNNTDYIIEPDSSLDPDNSSDAGLEFISPPMPVDEMFADMDKIVNWAENYGCYTNKSTGLHMNISVPDMSTAKLDFVKLALLMGDEYILEKFGRSANTYAKSAMKIVRDRVVDRPEDAAALMTKMKSNLDALATKVIHSGETNKYTSINTKDGYVEFRSPGGDWLSAYQEDKGKIENTMLRFVVALDAAMDPDKYREEYLKKLYKLLAPKGENDTLAYFAKFAAGELPQSALKSFVKQAQLERNLKKGNVGGEKFWWEVKRPGYMASIEVVATSKEEALAIAVEPGNYPDWAKATNLEAKPLRPYSKAPVKATAGEPQPAGATGSVKYEIFNRSTDQVYRTFYAADDDMAREIGARYREELRANSPDSQTSGIGLRRAPIPGSTQDLQRQRAQAAQQQPGNEFTGTWRILDANDREIHRFSGIGNNQGDANRHAMEWLRAHPENMRDGVAVVPEMR